MENLQKYEQEAVSAQNAQYSEMSRQQTTDAKIKAQGGIDAALTVDTLEASQKASQQKGSVEALDAKAKEIGEKIGKSAAEVLEQVAGKKAGGQLAADHARILTADEKFKNGGYEGFMADSATVKTAADAAKLNLSESKEMMQERADAYIKSMVDATVGNDADKERARQKAIKDLHASGLTDEKGNALGGLDAAIAAAEATAGTMNQDTSMMIGGNRVNFSQNPHTGETLANVDGSMTNRQGSSSVVDNTHKEKFRENLDTSFAISKIKNGGKDPSMKEVRDYANREEAVTSAIRENWGKAATIGGMYDLLKETDWIPKDMSEQEFASYATAALGTGGTAAVIGTGAEIYGALTDNKKIRPSTYGKKMWDAGTKAYNKLTGKPTESIFNESTNKSANSPDHDSDSHGSDPSKNNAGHGNSFDGQKYDPSGRRTKAYQDHLDSIAKNKRISKTKRFGMAAVAGLVLEEAANFFTDGKVHEAIGDAADWLTSPHGPPGGSGQTPGSSGVQQPQQTQEGSSDHSGILERAKAFMEGGIFGSAGKENTLKAVELATTVSQGVVGAIVTPTDLGANNSDNPVQSYDWKSNRSMASDGKVLSIPDPESLNATVPQHAQQAFSQPSGFNTMQAMQQDGTLAVSQDNRTTTETASLDPQNIAPNTKVSPKVSIEPEIEGSKQTIDVGEFVAMQEQTGKKLSVATRPDIPTETPTAQPQQSTPQHSAVPPTQPDIPTMQQDISSLRQMQQSEMMFAQQTHPQSQFAENFSQPTISKKDMEKLGSVSVGGSIDAPGFAQPLPTIGGGSAGGGSILETQQLQQTQTLESTKQSTHAAESIARANYKATKTANAAQYVSSKELNELVKEQLNQNKNDDEGPGATHGDE